MAGLEPDEFVEDMKKKGIRVPGIGHRIKSKVSTSLVNCKLHTVAVIKCKSWRPRSGGDHFEKTCGRQMITHEIYVIMPAQYATDMLALALLVQQETKSPAGWETCVSRQTALL